MQLLWSVVLFTYFYFLMHVRRRHNLQDRAVMEFSFDGRDYIDTNNRRG